MEILLLGNTNENSMDEHTGPGFIVVSMVEKLLKHNAMHYEVPPED